MTGHLLVLLLESLAGSQAERPCCCWIRTVQNDWCVSNQIGFIGKDKPGKPRGRLWVSGKPGDRRDATKNQRPPGCEGPAGVLRVHLQTAGSQSVSALLKPAEGARAREPAPPEVRQVRHSEKNDSAGFSQGASACSQHSAHPTAGGDIEACGQSLT